MSNSFISQRDFSIIGPKLHLQTLNSYKNIEEQNVVCCDDFSLKQFQTNSTAATTPSMSSKGNAMKLTKCSVKFNINTVTCNYRTADPVVEITKNVKKLIQNRPYLHWVNPTIKI